MRRQLGNNLFQLLQRLAPLQDHIGSGTLVGNLHLGLVVVAAAVALQRKETQTLTTQMVDAVVGCDAEEPTAERILLVVAVQKPENLDKDFLGQVARILIVADHAPAQVIDGASVTRQDRLKGGLFAPFAAADQFLVGATIEHHSKPGTDGGCS